MRASESDRTLICSASLVLPRSNLKSPDTIKAAEYGTAAHAWVETGEETDRNVTRKVLRSGINREKWWPPEGRHEVAFALNLFTLELRKYKGKRAGADAWKRKYDGKKQWLTGTVDYLHTHLGRPWVDDFKSGKWPVDYRTAQVTSYLLLPWVDEGCPNEGLYYRSITQWPLYPLDALPTRTGLGDPATAIELKMHLDDLKFAIENPEPNPQRIDTGLNPDGTRRVWDPENPPALSVCAFCPCRVEHPVSEWLHNYRFRALPHCYPGALKLLNERNK